jgi:uncharacterized membrane protein
MKNKNVGWLVIGISVFIFAIIIIFNFGLRDVLNATCSMGPTCSMHKTLSLQTWISFAIAFVIFLIGLFLILAKENEKIVVKKIKPTAHIAPKEFDKKNLKHLDKEELDIMNVILGNKGSIFQSELVDKTGLGKVKVTRLLDSLEAQGLIERKRRGMTNIVMIKQN